MVFIYVNKGFFFLIAAAEKHFGSLSGQFSPMVVVAVHIIKIRSYSFPKRGS